MIFWRGQPLLTYGQKKSYLQLPNLPYFWMPSLKFLTVKSEVRKYSGMNSTSEVVTNNFINLKKDSVLV